MKRLAVFLKGSVKECILAPLFKLLEAIFELLVPLIVSRVIDEGIGQGDTSLIWRCGGMLLLLAFVGLCSAITAQFFAARAATGFAARLKGALMRHIYALSPAQADKLSVPTLITRLTGDVEQVQNGVNMALRLLLRSPFIVFGAMIMAFTVDTRSALIFAVIIPLLGLCVGLLLKKTLPMFRKIQSASDDVLRTTRENLTGVRVIRAFGRQENEQESMQHAHDRLTGLQIGAQWISGLLNPLTMILIDCALAALIYTGAVRVDIGILTQGQVVALSNYMSQILVELVKLANLLVTLTRAMACAGRIGQVLEIEPDLQSGTAEGDWSRDDLIVFDHAGLRYHSGAEEALHDLSFTVRKGEKLGIIGGTGSGKSSVLSLILRMYDASSGRVCIAGQSITQMSLSALREHIGYAPQRPVLFCGTIRENLLMGNRKADEAQLRRALRIAQAEDFVYSSPKGLDRLLEQQGRNISGGQRQRLGLARALVREGDILLLDDVSSALDAQTDADLRRALWQMPRDVTMLIVSQRASSVMDCDRILVLEDGKMAGLDSHENLLKNCPVYRETYEAQYPGEAAK